MTFEVIADRAPGECGVQAPSADTSPPALWIMR